MLLLLLLTQRMGREIAALLLGGLCPWHSQGWKGGRGMQQQLLPQMMPGPVHWVQGSRQGLLFIKDMTEHSDLLI
jgi:hypothetical protein